MKPIPVDFNAALKSGALWLDFPDTRQALSVINAQPKDLVWMSDGDIPVEARLADDPSCGLFAVPRWKTLVRFDDPPTDTEATEKPKPAESS